MGGVAFVGDIHGELNALLAMVAALRRRGTKKIVFLGDYINKGPDSRGVIDALIELSTSGDALCLRGNHEDALLDCLKAGDARTLLRMSGAPTIRSYVGRDVGPDVVADLSGAVPSSHLEFIASLPVSHESESYFASHEPDRDTVKFAVSAHIFAGLEPRISGHGAAIDTGCGSPGGLLTGLVWPTLEYVQVDSFGRVTESTSEPRG